MSELFYVLTEKITKPLKRIVAAEVVRDYVMSDNWTKLNYSSATALKAAISASYYNSPFWDNLIAETMKENEISLIFTENDKDFRRIAGIKAVNPFTK